ncbi:MAG: DUF411 domain-containing protein [Gammaproteobacteria bacterium]|nr:DUF411 domain-containing protein [Gammaproteobacteria bacterium]
MVISLVKATKVAVISLVSFSLFACNGENEATSSELTLSQATTLLSVYKSEQCGCCKDWISHVKEHGFKTTVDHPSDLYALKERLGIGRNYQSCHTAVTQDGLVFEGHVPAKYIKQFMANAPQGALGLSVPGMVVGSPGMEVDDKFRAYKIIQLNRDGSTSLYASIDSYQQQF